MNGTNREPQGYSFDPAELQIIDALTTARAHVGSANPELCEQINLALLERVRIQNHVAGPILWAFVASEISRKRAELLELLASSAAIADLDGDDDLYCALMDSASHMTFQGQQNDDGFDQDWNNWTEYIWEEAESRHRKAREAAGQGWPFSWSQHRSDLFRIDRLANR